MATPGFMYDHPQYTKRQWIWGHAPMAAGTAAAGAIFNTPRAIKFNGAFAVVQTAGTVTSAAIRLVSISGTTTTTHGTYTMSTAVAQSMVTCTLASAVSVAAGGRLYAEHLLDATQAVRILWEYREDPSAQPLH